MNETLLESANLYALGLLTEAEQVAFERELRANPALRREVYSLQESAISLAASAPQVAPPVELRAELLAAFNALPPRIVVPLSLVPASKDTVTFLTSAESQSSLAAPPAPSLARFLHFIPWAAAAAMAVLFYQNKEAIFSARALADSAQTEAADASQREKHYLASVNLSEAAKAHSETSLADLRGQFAQLETALALLNKERETLRLELAVLRNDRQLDKTRIAVLGSLLKDQPQAVAVSLWRQESQDGLLVVENMPALPAGREYQLWVIDPNLKTPISAGVFKVDVEGKVRLEFKPIHKVQSAYKFAVTMEKEGGAVVPTMDQMMVIGG